LCGSMELIIENKTNSPKSIKVSVVYHYETTIGSTGGVVINDEMLRKKAKETGVIKIEILEG